MIAHLRTAEAKADTVDGVWKLPDGQAYYEVQLEGYTTLPLIATDVHALGLREVASIHDAMRAIMARTGFQGDLQAFFTFIRRDARFSYPARDEGRAAYVDQTTDRLGANMARPGGLSR